MTLFEVVHEATHVFMRGEAIAKGLFSADGKVVSYLAKNPEQVKLLIEYWENVQRLLALNILILEMEKDIVLGAQSERTSAGLLTNDSLIVAAMREYGVTRIATNDKQFETVAGIFVFAPNDI
jgi:predicted nucleic acid-binding protein